MTQVLVSWRPYYHRVGGLVEADSAGCTGSRWAASSAIAGLMFVVGWRTYPGGRDTSGLAAQFARHSRYRASVTLWALRRVNGKRHLAHREQ